MLQEAEREVEQLDSARAISKVSPPGYDFQVFFFSTCKLPSFEAGGQIRSEVDNDHQQKMKDDILQNTTQTVAKAHKEICQQVEQLGEKITSVQKACESKENCTDDEMVGRKQQSLSPGTIVNSKSDVTSLPTESVEEDENNDSATDQSSDIVWSGSDHTTSRFEKQADETPPSSMTQSGSAHSIHDSVRDAQSNEIEDFERDEVPESDPSVGEGPTRQTPTSHLEVAKAEMEKEVERLVQKKVALEQKANKRKKQLLSNQEK